METEKNIKKEIERYLKYNYSKRDVLTYLKRDGYSDEEIKENSSVFNSVDRNYLDNVLYFLPALLFLILTILVSLGRFYADENTINKTLYLTLSGILVYITFGFCKNKPKYIIATAILIFISTLYYSYVFFITQQVDEFGFSLSIPSKIGVIILHILMLRGSYKMYKDALPK
ncbi:hypothetical protein [Flavobacterium sp.]|uniref:hypothetical protein n=1 Tax=Flavobacterium sp. TaxID=239 RepID=UPI003751AEAB